LAALFSQSVKPLEIILLDNSSADNSSADNSSADNSSADNSSADNSIYIARQYPSVRIIEMNQNTGFAYGNNFAINAVDLRSECIALLNPDAFPERQWLEALLAATELHPEFDVFGSKLVNEANPTMLDGTGDASAHVKIVVA